MELPVAVATVAVMAIAVTVAFAGALLSLCSWAIRHFSDDWPGLYARECPEYDGGRSGLLFGGSMPRPDGPDGRQNVFKSYFYKAEGI